MSRKSTRDDSRDENGRFLKGGICHNPFGRAGSPLKKRERKRTYLSVQVYADFQSICEEPRNATLGGKKVRLPAIQLVNRLLFEKAIAGDQRSIHRVLDMRERFARARTRDLAAMVERALDIIQEHELGERQVPESQLLLAHEALRVMAEGQFMPMNPEFDRFALMTTAQIKATQEQMRKDREEMAAYDAKHDQDPLDEVPGKPEE